MTVEQKLRKLIREELMKEAVGTPKQTIEKLVKAFDICQKELNSMNAASLDKIQKRLNDLRSEVVKLAYF